MAIKRKSWAEYEEISHLHGVVNYSHYGSWTKLIWLSIIAVCLGAMSYNVWRLIVDLRGEPIVTYVKNFDRHYNFPTIMLCTMNFKYNHSTFFAEMRNHAAAFPNITYAEGKLQGYLSSLESLNYLPAAMRQPHLQEDQWEAIGVHLWEKRK